MEEERRYIAFARGRECSLYNGSAGIDTRKQKIRLTINSDAKNEVDDQYAIVHTLLTPKLIVNGVIAAYFGVYRTNTSMQESYDEVFRILELMNVKDKIAAFRGPGRTISDE